ncbi:MAG: hypothetical protein ABR509_00380 [Candidatus Limnocylindria bacterium]
MTLARILILGAVLSAAVGVAQRALTRLVLASGAQADPALVLVVLLAAFLGVLTAVATRLLTLPGATAPTALVIGYTIVAGALGGPDEGPVALVPPISGLTAAQALGLVAACIAAAVTLSVPGDRDR